MVALADTTTDPCTCGLAQEKDQAFEFEGEEVVIPARTHHFWSCPLSDPVGDLIGAVRRARSGEWTV